MPAKDPLTSFEIDRRARSCFEGLLPEEWTASSPRDDLGIDYWVQISQSARATGLSLYVQLKGTTRIRASNAFISVRISSSNATAYIREDKPVLLVACNVRSTNPGERTAYYTWVQDYLRYIEPPDGKTGVYQNSVTIKIPISNSLDRETCRTRILEYLVHINKLGKNRLDNLVRPSPLRAQAISFKYGNSHLHLPNDASTTSKIVCQLLLSAQEYIDNGLLPEATATLLKAQALLPTALGAMNLGNCYAALGYNEIAVTAFEECLQLTPAFAPALSSKGSVLFQMGLLQDALDHHEAAAKLRPDDPQVLVNVGITLEYIASTRSPSERDALLERSIDYFHRALLIDPNNDVTLVDAALVCFKMFNFNHSIQFLERAVTINPNNILAWRRFKGAYLMMQEPEKAAAADRQAKQLGGGLDTLKTLRILPELKSDN